MPGPYSRAQPVFSVDPETGAPVSAGGNAIVNPLGAPVTGQVKIVTDNVAVALPAAALLNGLVVKAKSTNAAQTITPSFSAAVGGSTVDTLFDGTGKGYPLAPGEAISFAAANASQVYVNGKAGDVFTYAGG